MPHSGPHFLRFWCDLVPKSSILGAPWRPAGPKMAPKIAQWGQNGTGKFTDRLPRDAPGDRDRFWSAPWHHFFGFLKVFDPLFTDFN